MFAPSHPGNYGFGWFIGDAPVRKYWHEGSDPGFASYEIRYPASHSAIIVLSNVDDAPVREIAKKIDAALSAK